MALYIISLKIKIFLYMRLESYKEAKNVPEKYLSSLVDAEIECWWSKPFSEYRICQNDKCWATYSIEDVYWSVEEYQDKFRKSNLIDKFDCLECKTETWYVYEKEKFLELMKEYIKMQVSAVLALSEKHEIKWFWVLSKTNIESLLNIEINTRPWSYNMNEILDFFSKKFFSENNISDKELLCLLHIYISPSNRGKNICFELLKKLFLLKKDNKDIPIVMETRYDSKLYPISRLMWFEDMLNDKYWYVLQYLSKFSLLIDFFNNNNNFFTDELKIKKNFFKKYANDILLNNPTFWIRKFYN